MRLFPTEFRPDDWKGARREQFTAASDIFQQLVGDALLLHFSGLAHVTSTSGRDGGIDAWVEDSARATAQFEGFQFPLIVECKHHDDSLAGVSENINQGWTGVREKLNKQARSGWQGLYSPWRQARAYLYCISARFPHQHARDEFERGIRAFFAALPVNQRPNIDPAQIHIWDWSDLQPWLNQSVTLCDQWLGIESAEWIDHSSLQHRLAQTVRSGHQAFQSYLLGENLPFVPPPDDDPAHPAKLLQALSEAEDLLLIGEGGIGKTRTMHEVATLAQSRGWRVLHLLPSERELDLRAAMDVLLGKSQDTLVLIDYIDQVAHFDARYWQSSLLPEARRRGIGLHLLTNARPSGSSESLDHLRESGLFRIVEMTRSEEHRHRVTMAIEDRLCPTAIAQIGRDAVKHHCGSRPIIAMFIAQSLERLAQNRQLGNSRDDIPRPDDLLGWIRKRLREAQLVPVPHTTAAKWQPPLPHSRELVAAAAVLAACPFPATELPSVVQVSLNSQDTFVDAAWIISTLERDGWIESGGDGVFRTPHDAIPDEVLRQLLVSPDTVMSALLSSAYLGRPLGRFARSLGRLSGIAALSPQQRAGVERAAERWLTEHAILLGNKLPDANPDVVAYAFGALFDYRPWCLAAQSRWHELVTPWLNRHSQLRSARHLLHRGLKLLPDPSLLPAALVWLNSHGHLKSASFVLAPLLALGSVRLGEQEATVLSAAVAWLQHENHATSTDAGFVLPPLLAWDADRLGTEQGTVLSAAVAWLQDENRGTSPEAPFVFHPLLAWDAARLGTEQGTVLSAAVAWLQHENRGTSPEAPFVFHPLLAWDAARLGTEQGTVLSAAVAWLQDENRGTSPEAQFVFHHLLAWDAARLGKEQGSVLSAAVAWLQHENHGTSPEAQFVFHHLLAWDAARLGTEQGTVLSAAVAWLQHENHATSTDAGFVLPPLLAWDADRLGTEQGTVLSAAVAWLQDENHGTSADAGFVLAPLLAWDAARLGTEQGTVLNAAVAWLQHENHSTSIEAGFVLPPLLRVSSLTTAARLDLTRHAVKWLDRYPERDDSTHVLKGLLQVIVFLDSWAEFRSVLMCAAKWLDLNSDHAERGYVIARVLRTKKLPHDLWPALALAGLSLLEQRPVEQGDDYILNGIATRISTLPEHTARWTALSCRWIACAQRPADVVSFFTYCKNFLPEEILASVRPDLIAANKARSSPIEFDWSRPSSRK